MAAQSNIIKDVGTMTKIPNKILNELAYREELCIGSAIHDAILQGEEAAVLNIGIGTLSIELATKKCKFIPSRELSLIIKKSIDDKIDPVEAELDQAIVDKLIQLSDEAF